MAAGGSDGKQPVALASSQYENSEPPPSLLLENFARRSPRAAYEGTRGHLKPKSPMALRSAALLLATATGAYADMYNVLSPHLLPPDGGCKAWSDVPEMDQ
jgi:hypothetical protein